MTVTTASHEAAERRMAARSLLKTPILTAAAPEELMLVRRHGKSLKQLFFSRFGYNLTVETGFARLAKAGLDATTPPRPAQRSTEQGFTPRHYTYLALTCSALLSPTVGEQVLLSALADQIRADAVLAGLDLPDTVEQARHLTQALYLLMDWGVISETDGAVASWSARQEECLLDVNRPLLPHLLATTLREASTPEALLTVREDHFNPEAPRRSLRRKLVENPLVRREDLSEAERDVLSRERRELARRLDEDFGLILEVRSEGALVYDPDEELTDIGFPGKGTVAHAALLLIDALTDTLRPTAESRITVDGIDVPGVLASWDLVRESIALLVEQYGSAFATRFQNSPDGHGRSGLAAGLTEPVPLGCRWPHPPSRLCEIPTGAAEAASTLTSAEYSIRGLVRRCGSIRRGGAMTVILPPRTEPSTGLEDQVPIHHPDRWRLHRAGITNVWYYYDNEFDFSGGRMILRGTNGSGKSRALEMLLPFVLDADRRRMDSTGSGTVKLETLMRYGGEEQTNRLGYLWLELVRGNDEPEYLTIGALIRYSSSTTRAKVWYFTTPLRVGEDLVLLDATRHPLGLKNLTELIGEENLTESPTIHSDRVAHRVFGLSGQSGKERYSGLLQLLHTLRSPDVGNRIEDNKLAKILSDALPPLSDHALHTAGSHLDSLSEARQAQQDLIKTQAQVRTFMTTYRRYVRTLLSTAIKAVESQAGTVRVAAKAAGELRQKSGQLRLDARTEDGKAVQLESTAGDLKAAIEGWTKLPAHRAGMQLEGLVDQAAALETALQAQIQASGSMREAEAESVGAANRSAGDLTQAVDGAEELRSACRETLLRAGVPVGALPGPIRSTRSEAEPLEELVQLSADDAELLVRPRPDAMTVTPDDLEGAAAAAGILKDGAQQRASAATNRLATARKLVREQAAVEQADERAGSAEGLATEAAATAEQAAETRDDTARSLAADWRDWATSDTTQEVLGAVDWATSAAARLLSDFEALVGDSQQPTLEELDQAAQVAAGPARLRLAGQLADIDVANRNDEQRRRQLEAEQAALRADEDPEPEMVPWARTVPADAVPFWRCVDFTTEAEGDEAARGAIEAALQASGLLTAGVCSGGSLTTADGQVLIGPSSQNARRPVTTLLRPAPESPVAAEIVEDVLSRIGLGPHGHSTWVDVDGCWGNGLLTGRYLADRPRHIGAAARQAAREARLAEIAADLDALDRAAEARRIERDRVEVDSARLDSHLLTKPSSGELANRRWAARTTYATAEKTWREAVRTRNEAEQKRQAWARASDEHRRLCDHSNLPHAADELVDVERAASDSATLCGRLATAIRTVSTRRDLHRDELGRVETATGRRLTAEGKVHSAWRGWRDVAQQLERIREDFGTETDEIMRRIAEAKRTSVELEQRASAGRLKAQELTTEAAVTETEANQADANVLHERQILADAVSHLRSQLTLPGIVEAAIHGRPAVGSGDIEHVVRLGTDLDDESPDLQRACRQLRETIEAGDSSAPVDENNLLKAQQTLDRELSTSFDTVLSMVEGVRLFELIDADGRFPIALAARRIDERVEQARAALSEREYVVFSEYVVGGVADELRRRLGDADKLVKAMDTTLKGITTSQGIRVRLRWELLHDETSAIGRIRELCLKSSAFRSRPDTDELIQLLKERVTAEFETDPAAGYVAALESALDYRRWHHIDVKITRPGQEETAVNRRSRLSQGERRFVSYVVLFAAADTYFSSLPEAGKALRLITLDDAFAKVDDRTIAELLGLLVRLDLDFCLTGHALWGTYPEVPALDVYEVRREAGLPAVTTHVHWDGRTRHLRPV